MFRQQNEFRKFIPVSAVAGMCLFAVTAFADGKVPVAVVEDVSPNVTGVSFMDYVAAGDKIRLMPADMLVLGYMKSCIQETIRGGAVTVGREQSEVSAGNVVRTRVNCDGGRMQLTSAQSNNSAAMAFRSPPNAKGPRKGSKVHLTLFGASPIFDVGGGGELVVERIDIPGERHEFKLESNTLVQGRFFDMAASGTSLVPGGVYRSLAGQGEIVFRVDPQAQSGRIPAISRLVRFSR